MAVADVPEQLDGADESDPGTILAAAEDHALLMAALDAVPPACQTLLRLLIADPPLSYDDISAPSTCPREASGPPGSGASAACERP